MKKKLALVLSICLLSSFVSGDDIPGALNLWVSPSSPSGAWKYSGEAFPAERIIELAAAAGASDLDFGFDGPKRIVYDSKVSNLHRDRSVPDDAIDRLLAAAQKHKIRVWAVLTPAPLTKLADGSEVMTTSDPRSIEHWRQRVEEIAELFKKRYPEALAGIVLHEINRPESGNSHADELREFSDFCQAEFGETYLGDKMPSGHDASLWNRRFNLYRVHCLNHWSKVLIDEAARHGMKTGFIQYDAEAHNSFSASWGYDTLFYERHCVQTWVNEHSYPTLKGAYVDCGISYRGVNVPLVVAMVFHERPKGFFEMRAAFFPEIVREFYLNNKVFSATHGDYFHNYSRKSPELMKLFFGAEQVSKWLGLATQWTGGKSLARIGIIASSLPNILRRPVNPGSEYRRCVSGLHDAIAKQRPVTKLMAGSLLMLNPQELRKQFDLLILPEEQGIGMSRESIDALKAYLELGGKLLGVGTPITTARRDLTDEKEVTPELFGVSVKSGKLPGFVRINGKKFWSNSMAAVSGDPKAGSEFIPVSFSPESESIFHDAVNRLLPDGQVKLLNNDNFTIYNACEKDGLICISLPSEKPAKATLRLQVAPGQYEVRNILTGKIVAAADAATLATGVAIQTDYASEPYVLAAGLKSAMQSFTGIYPDNKVFAELGKKFQGVQNPEVPLLIPEKPGIKVGIYMSGRGADKIFAALSDIAGINAFMIPRLDPSCINGSDVVIVPQPSNLYFYRDGVEHLRKGLENGKGVLLCHTALNSGMEDFPEIFAAKPFKNTMLADATLKIEDGRTFTPGFSFDHYKLQLKPEVEVLARSVDGAPVIAIGKLGNGQLAVFGTLVGHFGAAAAGTDQGIISGIEKELFVHAVQKLGGMQ